MWYAVHCPKGAEDTLIALCKSRIPSEILTDAFTFRYRCLKKRQGTWQEETQSLFPDYVFLETDSSEALLKLWDYPAKPRALSNDETKLLEHLGGPDHELGFSRGYIRGGATHVTEGPLAGLERQIGKIDRHKRLAWLKPEVQGHPVKAGLEIIEKG